MSQAPAIPRVLHGFGPRLQFHMPETWQKLGKPGRDPREVGDRVQKPREVKGLRTGESPLKY
jgi:hypothetical protein